MRPLHTVEEVRAAERAAIASGVSEPELMRMAGTRFADLILADSRLRGGKAVLMVGPGNNGGDGLIAAARLIEQGWACSVFGWRRTDANGLPIRAELGDAIRWLGGLAELDRACQEADVIVDAVFGIGGRADLPAEVASSFSIAREARIQRGTPLWALDVPSGVDSDSGAAGDAAFPADVTVMLGLPKIGLYRAPALRYAGRLELIEIGLTAPDVPADRPALITETDARRALPRRPRDAHKSSVGWLMVLGGAPNYYGAPRLAAEAAARAGAGLVCLAVPRSIVPAIASAVPEATFLPLPEPEFGDGAARSVRLIRESLPRYRALLVGPGLGLDEPTGDVLIELFGIRRHVPTIGFTSGVPSPEAEPFQGKGVVDADALNWLATTPGWPDRVRQAELILTPHPGELSRLMNVPVDQVVADPWAAARAAAQAFGQVVVLKQAHPVVAHPDGWLALAPQVEPALASAGTGDVLAGMIAGLLTQGMTAFEAAFSGLYLGSLAARLAVERVGTLGLVARDVIESIPGALKGLYDARW